MKQPIQTVLSIFLLAWALLPSSLPAQTEKAPEASNLSLKLETTQAITRALRWLGHQQEPEGYWSSPDHPAITALIVRAMLESPAPPELGRENPMIEPALQFILSRVQPDGGIYTPGHGLANYNTSISLMALAVADNPDYAEIIERARSFVIRGQQIYASDSENALYSGGIGYGSSYTHSDMTNTMFALQAIAETRTLFPGSEDQDTPELDWDAAVRFLSRCQNLKATNDTGFAAMTRQTAADFSTTPACPMLAKWNSPTGAPPSAPTGVSATPVSSATPTPASRPTTPESKASSIGSKTTSPSKKIPAWANRVASSIS
jgi:squalene-hopene/tetraprenyl-beta-curcumene cyclase